MLRSRREQVDMPTLRAAVRRIVESERYDAWLLEMPDHVLVQVAAPLEMLGFQHYVKPPQDKLLLRAARVVWEGVADLLDDCPPDMAADFAALGAAVDGTAGAPGGQG